MSTSNTTRHGGASILAVTAITMMLGLAGPTHAQVLAPTPGPTPGECKPNAVTGTSTSPASAQQVWSTRVTNLYTAQWSIWIAAADKQVMQFQVGSRTMYRAVARPCYVPAVP